VRIFVFVVLMITAAMGPAAADPGFLCSDSLRINFPDPKGPGDPGFSAFIVESVRFHDLLTHGPIESGVDFSVMTPEQEVRFYRDYCTTHPTNTDQDADFALYDRMVELTAAKVAHSKPVALSDFEAPADVRAYVLEQARPLQMGKVVQPEEVVAPAVRSSDIIYYSRLAKDKTGRILVVPDTTSLAYGIGDLAPDFGLHPVVLATVFPRNWTHDKPPSGDEDKPARSGTPAFYIGQ
jgi:hypothetical protein